MKLFHGRRRRLFQSGVSAAVLLASAALAAPSSAATALDKDSNTVGEVVVTAQFREQSLQKTPLSITAVNAQMMENRSQTDITQVAAQAPNVSLRPAGASFGSSLVAYIRGVGQTDFNFSGEPGVGMYVDDVYYSTLTGSIFDLLDLDRVEVLRGPQGTLAGKNSIGGAIKLYSKKPNGDGGGFFEGTYGSLNRVDIRGGLDVPLVADKLFLRVSGSAKHHDGYVTRLDYNCTHPGTAIPSFRVGTGCELGKDGGEAYDALRVALRWLPSENVEVNIAADATDDNSGVQANTLLRAGPNGTSLNGVPYGCAFVTSGPNSCDTAKHNPFTSYATFIDPTAPTAAEPWKPVAVDPINHYKGWGVSGTIDWKLGQHVSLKSITAFRKYVASFADDNDASPIEVQMLLQTLHHRQISQELRLNADTFDDKVNLTVGGFYFDQNGSEQARVDIEYVPLFDFVHGPDTTPAQTKAAYAAFSWQITSNLSLNAGARYTDEVKDYTFHRHNPDGTLPVCGIPLCAANWAVFGVDGKTGHFAGTRWDYRANLAYQFTPDIMAYAQISTGYKGGGINARPFFAGPPGPPCANNPTCQIAPFNPESLTAYEGGLKTNLFDHRLRLNASGFINKYDNIILFLTQCDFFSPFPGAPCAMPVNAGSADVKGLEFEAEAHPVQGLEIDGSLSYLDFQYTNTNFAVTGIPLSAKSPYTPTWKWSVGAQYEFQAMGGSTLTPRIDASYQSDVFGGAANTPATVDVSKTLDIGTGANRISGYTLVNARVTWKSPDRSWSAAFEVTNLTNKLYYVTLFDAPGNNGGANFTSGQPGVPREWAVTVKKTF